MIDYILYIFLRVVIFFLRFLPLRAWLFLAQCLGWIYYYFAGKKNKKAYANLKTAFPDKSRRELKHIMRRMYQRFAQNVVETLYLPYMDEHFIREHVRVPNLGDLQEVLKGEHGTIFLGCHAGSWELSNIASAIFFSAQGTERKYAMLVQPQHRYKRLDAYLNGLREAKGCSVIRVVELKRMFEHLSDNNILGAVADHGGKDGIPVEFFEKLAMTPTGSVKLAKKLSSQIILAFMHRIHGPSHEMLLRPYTLISTGEETEDLKVNLTRINKIFQEWITQYPEEYLWFYKRWKYSPQKNILILSDGKLGHVKQSLALVEMMKDLGLEIKSEIIEIKAKRLKADRFLSLAGFFFGPKATLSLLTFCLEKETAQKLVSVPCDMVISSGSSLAAINLAVAAENSAKSIAIMRPGIFDFSNFHLVIMPEHDRPPRSKNVLVSVGSLNAIDKESLKSDFQRLLSSRSVLKGLDAVDKPKIGVLIGGDSKNYKLIPDAVAFLCDQLKKVLDDLDGYLFLTTSRRTPEDVIDILKSYFKNNPRCKLFVIATEANPAGTVGGIFYLSDCIVVSGESISMVSEAASCGKYVIVFEPHRKVKDNKTRRFLDDLAEKKYIYLLKLNEIYDKLTWIIRTRPPFLSLDTKGPIQEELKKLLR